MLGLTLHAAGDLLSLLEGIARDEDFGRSRHAEDGAERGGRYCLLGAPRD